MKITFLFAGVIVAALLFAGCQDENSVQAPNVPEDPNRAAIGLIDQEIVSCDDDSLVTRNRNFIAILSGREVVPPTDSRGRGVAKFKLSKDGGEISYKLIVANISNVVGANIHLGPAGDNGPAVVELHSDPTGHGRACGPIARGSFKPEDLTGPYAGSTDFSMFLADLHADSLYVNVTTSDGIDSTSGGSGDYNDGEIRGQMKSHPWKGHHPGKWDNDDHGKDKDKRDGKEKGKGHGHGGDNGRGDDHGEKNGKGRDDGDDDGHGG